MPHWDLTFLEYIRRRRRIKKPLTIIEISKIMMQLVDALEQVHRSKHTYNDLKLDNIMINRKSLRIALIDYGFIKPFVDDAGNHISEDAKRDTFEGNMLFSSLNQLQFRCTSRRDDLLSLSYMMIYLLNDLSFPYQDQVSPDLKNQTDVDKYLSYIDLKSQVSFRKMAKKINYLVLLKRSQEEGSLVNLEDIASKVRHLVCYFFKTVQSISFAGMPDYVLLKSILQNIINIQVEETDIPVEKSEPIVVRDSNFMSKPNRLMRASIAFTPALSFPKLMELR